MLLLILAAWSAEPLPSPLAIPAAAETAAPAVPAAAPSPAAPPVVMDRVVAAVNDDVITFTELYEFAGDYVEDQVKTRGEAARHAAEHEVLERLIARKLVDQEITGLRLDVSGQELDRAIDDIAGRNGIDRASLQREVEKTGMTWEQYRSQLEGDIRQMKFAQTVLRPRINVTEDELRDVYNRLGNQVPRLAHVQAIYLEIPDAASKDAVLAKARALREQAMAGADFGKLSVENDQAGFGGQGGEMGHFKAGELMADLDKVVFSTAVGTVSEPVVVGGGVFLLKVVELESGAEDFAAVRGQLMDQVFQQRMAEEQDRWYQQARARASIRILLPQ